MKYIKSKQPGISINHSEYDFKSELAYSKNDKKITKNLLSEILELEVTHICPTHTDNITEFYCKSTSIFYVGGFSRKDFGHFNRINTYELAHKCKEWAFKNGYYLTIYNDAIDVVLQSNCKVLENVTNDTFMYDPNLVFKACEWILDNKED